MVSLLSREVSSCFPQPCASPLSDQIPGEQQTWLVPQCVLGHSHQDCVPQSCLVPSVQMQMEVLLLDVQMGARQAAVQCTLRTTKSMELGTCFFFFLNDDEPSLETIELEDFFHVASNW